MSVRGEEALGRSPVILNIGNWVDDQVRGALIGIRGIAPDGKDSSAGVMPYGTKRRTTKTIIIRKE